MCGSGQNTIRDKSGLASFAVHLVGGGQAPAPCILCHWWVTLGYSGCLGVSIIAWLSLLCNCPWSRICARLVDLMGRPPSSCFPRCLYWRGQTWLPTVVPGPASPCEVRPQTLSMTAQNLVARPATANAEPLPRLSYTCTDRGPRAGGFCASRARTALPRFAFLPSPSLKTVGGTLGTDARRLGRPKAMAAETMKWVEKVRGWIGNTAGTSTSHMARAARTKMASRGPVRTVRRSPAYLSY